MPEPIKLDRATYAELLENERRLHDFLGELDKADECGIDCSLMRAERIQILERISKLKEHYAPSAR